MVYILFVTGFYLLVKGADLLVDGAASLAKRHNVPEMVVGLTVVSFGTSVPELVVNIFASIRGDAGIAIGNIFGSNIANILLILGIAAIICPLPIRRNTIMSEIPFVLIATLLVGFLANVSLFSSGTEYLVNRIEGSIMLLFFGLYLIYIINLSREQPDEFSTEGRSLMSGKRSFLVMGIGIIGLYLGGKWIVDGAVHMASVLGSSREFIGLTVVAVGTSLPELVTSVVAARKKNMDIAVGNVIGSNIFNILWILGLSAVIRPLSFNVIGNSDILVMLFSSVLIILVIAFGKKNNISRASGIFFVFLYGAYIVYLIIRG